MIAERLHHLLQHVEWASNFDERTLQRAADYAVRRRVVALRFAPGDHADRCSLAGDIRGSQQRPYHCRIGVQAHDTRLTLDTACDCPVGVDCKHAAAMLLMTANLPPAAWPGAATVLPAPKRARLARASRAATAHPAGDAAMSDWAQWLQGVGSTPATGEGAVAIGRRMGVLLRRDHGGQLLAGPVWLRPGKSGRAALADPLPLRLDRDAGPLPAPATGWPDGVAGALSILLQEPHSQVAGKRWAAIRAAYHEQALETLLQHYPAYYEKASAPLSRGPHLPLQVRWLGLSDGSQQLVAGVDTDEPPLLLRGASEWYVLPMQRVYGRVEGDPQLLDRIAHAPPVLPEHVAALRAQLQSQQHAAGLPIPLPELREPPRVVQATPTPVLQLRTIELPILHPLGNRMATAVGCARLFHDYAGQLLASEPEETGAACTRMAQGTNVLEIVRDRATERVAETQMENLGMLEASLYAWEQGLRRVTLADNDFLLQPDERTPPLPAHDWQGVLASLAEAGFRFEYDASFAHDELIEIDDWHASLEAQRQRMVRRGAGHRRRWRTDRPAADPAPAAGRSCFSAAAGQGGEETRRLARGAG